MNRDRRSDPLSICHHFIVPRSYESYYILETPLKATYSLCYLETRSKIYSEDDSDRE